MAYALVSKKQVSGQGAFFQSLNILGSLGLGIAAAKGHIWSAVAVNTAWIAIGIFFLSRRFLQLRTASANRDSEHDAHDEIIGNRRDSNP